MAVGFSGSNGGIARFSSNQGSRSLESLSYEQDYINGPLELSYFVNNFCNLRCAHCYVGYEEKAGSLSVNDWKKVFSDALRLGALTFGNVGKEPLLSWERSLQLLTFFKEERKKSPRLRYGLVTNATLFTDERIEQLVDADPTYLDISIDGTEKVHDSIRGQGNYFKSIRAIERIITAAQDFSDRIFISFTLMGRNNDTSLIKTLISELREKGVRRFMISPYVISINQCGDDIGITEEQIANTYETLKAEANSWLNDSDELLLKVDYDTQKPLMDLLSKRGIIELENLMMDEYATIFNKFERIFINYIPVPRTLIRDIRISHDGFVGGCHDMFFKEYKERAIGNIKEKGLADFMKSCDFAKVR